MTLNSNRILNLGDKMGDLLTELAVRAENYCKWWENRKTSTEMIPPSPIQMRGEILEHVRKLVQGERDAIEEACTILSKHPTNATEPPLSSGMPGYDADARYAWLVLQDRMKHWDYYYPKRNIDG